MIIDEKTQPTVTIAIVTWNSEKDIADCLQPLQELPSNWGIWIADNNSADSTVKLVKEKFPGVNVIANKENLGFAEACNQIAAQSESDYILFLNPDAVAAKEELEKSLDEIVKNPKIGVLGVKMTFEDGEVQSTCNIFPTLSSSIIDNLGLYRFISDSKKEKLLGDFFDYNNSSEVEWVYGGFMLSPRSAFEKIGGMPEDYFLFAEDMDYCYQINQAGYQIWFYADAQIIHKGNRSAGQLPSHWRIERTLLSNYAFCFKNFGNLKTRLIQLVELKGNLLEYLNVKFRTTNANLLNESKIYRKFIVKSLKISRAETFRILHQRPSK